MERYYLKNVCHPKQGHNLKLLMKHIKNNEAQYKGNANTAYREKRRGLPRRPKSGNMVTQTISLQESLIDRMDAFLKKWGLYPSRSELMRVAIREYLIKLWVNKSVYGIELDMIESPEQELIRSLRQEETI